MFARRMVATATCLGLLWPALSHADEDTRPSKALIGAIGGVAAGSLIAGGVLGGLSLGKSSDQEGNPNSPPLYTRSLKDDGDQGKAMAIGAYVTLGVGAALTLVEAVLLYERFHKRSPKTQAALDFARGRF